MVKNWIAFDVRTISYRQLEEYVNLLKKIFDTNDFWIEVQNEKIILYWGDGDVV